MTAPRLVRPGDYHHVSRRCTLRLFYLRPDPEVIALFVWCLAEGERRFGVQTLRLMLMSNHYHALFFDPEGRLPDFLQWVHREVARGIQRIRRLPPGSGAVFDKAQSTADQIIASEEAFWKMMGYIHCNPVDAGICKNASDWTGTLTPAGVRELSAQRPDWMSDKSGPEHHALKIALPQHFLGESMSEEDYHQKLGEHDQHAIQEVRSTMRQEGRHHFKGVAKAMGRSPFSAPSSTPKRGSSAFVAVIQEALLTMRGVLRAFRQAYREALRSFQAGKRASEFPFGTWKMLHRLRCCAAPPG